jgi:dipeptidyl aminopeptidase/acylaminoacyl peptidase
VIAPEFRGSTGWGQAWHRAGWRQWGRAMQDDLADALAWAAREKLSDPARACLMGSSYGGYAALLGATLQAEHFRCAVAMAAVTDISLIYSIHWSDTSEEFKRWGMPTLVGDPKADASALAQVSPLARVAELKRPVLIAHGGADSRVPLEHWQAYVRAAEAARAPVTPVMYPDEGHGFYSPAQEADFYQRVEAFLALHLAPQAVRP